jgi:hypothetical protein
MYCTDDQHLIDQPATVWTTVLPNEKNKKATSAVHAIYVLGTENV